MTKLGRPPRSSTPATERFEVRLTQTELELWRKAAGDKPVGEWARATLNRAARRSK
jgi:hypothetical protein